MEEDGRRRLTVLEYVDDTTGFLRFRSVRGPPLDPGTSGSPILNEAGEIAAISSRYNVTRLPRLAKAMDIRHLSGLLGPIADPLGGRSSLP